MLSAHFAVQFATRRSRKVRSDIQKQVSYRKEQRVSCVSF